MNQFCKSSVYSMQNHNNIYNFLIDILNHMENKDDNFSSHKTT